MKVLLKLVNPKKSVSLTFLKSEKYRLTAQYLIEIDYVENKAVILNVFTHAITKFINRGFYHVDDKMIRKLIDNPKLKCVK